MKEVMATIQKLRRKAVETGSLKRSKEQELKKEGDNDWPFPIPHVKIGTKRKPQSGHNP
jgi:hypothetical protein